MKEHTTNYTQTFIEVAEDCKAKSGEIPPVKSGEKTVANLQFEMVYEHPYEYTSDDVVFNCFATKQKIAKTAAKKAREAFFSKGQPCLRASPLTKRYGWGVHFNEEGKIALYGKESAAYAQFIKDKSVKKVKAMKSQR